AKKGRGGEHRKGTKGRKETEARPGHKDDEGARHEGCVARPRLASVIACRPARADRAPPGTPRTSPPGPGAAARSRPPLSGTRACCRCRGARLALRRRRSAAT